jgi:hypothetical protein
MWELHLPHHRNGKVCKTVAYSHKSTISSDNLIAHPLANPNSLILDLKDDEESIMLRVISTYHACPDHSHTLDYLFQHDLDETVPTLLIGDFNTHSLHWSLLGQTLSLWRHAFEEWMDGNGLTVLNL